MGETTPPPPRKDPNATFYVVVKDHGNGFQCHFKVRHATFELAQAEAFRLAAQDADGKPMLVFRLVGRAQKSTPPVEWVTAVTTCEVV